jgi:hypothetical protein
MARSKKDAVKHAPIDVKDRVVGFTRARVSDVQTHPLNWRKHGKHQRQVMRGLYKEIGFAKPIDVYIPKDSDRLVLAGKLRAGVPCIMDGHLRTEELKPDYEVPLNITDLTEDEALKYLATADPVSALADQDDALFAECLSAIDTDDAAIQKMLGDLYDVPEGGDGEDTSDMPERFEILIDCKSESEQRALLERFEREGIKCRSLIS